MTQICSSLGTAFCHCLYLYENKFSIPCYPLRNLLLVRAVADNFSLLSVSLPSSVTLY